MTPEPVSPEGYRFKTFEACGVTDLGAACKELDKKLSRNEFLQTAAGAYPPVILLFSDGGPTDNWESGLDALKKNNWYKRSIKIAFAIGDDADRDVQVLLTAIQTPLRYQRSWLRTFRLRPTMLSAMLILPTGTNPTGKERLWRDYLPLLRQVSVHRT